MPDVFGKHEPQLIEAVAESDDDAQPGGEAPVS
jgi:hypothetical protein